MRLSLRLSAVGAAIALLTGCGTTVSPDAAATVNGTEISRDLLETVTEDSVDALLAAAETAQAAQGAGGEGFTDEQRELALQQQTGQMLTLLVQDAIIASVVSDAGVEVDESDYETVRADIVEAVQGEEQLEQLLAQDGLSVSLFDEVLVPQQARVLALREQLAEGESLETRTIRHILLETEQAANEVVAELEDGADFGELARERSVDTASAAQGGELPPAARGSYVPGFEEAAWEAELNEVVGPVESQFGFHVIEVLAEDVTPSDELESGQLDQIVREELNEMIEAAYADAEVQVNAAFGTWDEETRSVVPTENVGEPDAPLPPTEAPAEGGLEELEEFEGELDAP